MRILAIAFLLAFSPAPKASAEPSRELVALRGQKIGAVRFTGDAIPELLRGKFSGLVGQEFSPAALRSSLLWYHENGGDAYLRVFAHPSGRVLELVVDARQKLRVAEVVFEGNNTTVATVLQQQIEIKPGMEFEPEAAKNAAKKIVEFYSKQGYLASDVKFAFDAPKRELKFLVSEGEPTLISSLTISPIISVERKDLRERYEKDLLEAFALKPGDRIQRDKVLDGIQAVKDWLRDHDFLMARDPLLDPKVQDDGKVALSLNITYGPRIRYGFRGNTQFSYRELTALVSEVKEVASGADYLSTVRRRVLEAYKEIGFANAKITTLVKEDSARGIRYVSLIVSEGQKILVDGVDIEGVFSMSKEEAWAEFKKLGTRLVQRDFFDQEGINRAAELFAEKLKSRGFLSAKLEYVKLDFNENRTKVKVQVLFSEGVQTRVSSAEVVGVKSFPVTEVLAWLGLKEGEPFNIFAFESGLQQLEEKYKEIGNLNMQVVNKAAGTIVKYSRDNSQVAVRVEVEEGPAFRVGEVVVRGNKLTHARVVQREIPFGTGDLLRWPQVTEAEENLRKLNLFNSVNIRLIEHPGADDVKDVFVWVEEMDPGTFDIVPGFRNDLGLRLGFEMGYQNLGGWNRSVNASAVFNRRLQDYYNKPCTVYVNGAAVASPCGDWDRPEFAFSIGFKEPYFADWRVVFTSNFSILKRQYHSFDADVRRITFGFKRELTRFLSGFVEYGYEQVEIKNVIKTSAYVDDEKRRFIGSLTPGLVYDSRRTSEDRPNAFNPEKGIYSVNRFETASLLFGSMKDVAYYKASSFNSTYLRVFDDVVLALAMNVGWQRSNVYDKPIPSYKLFRLGGLGSIRGYNEDEIEVATGTVVKGVLGSLNYRGELRVPLSGNFGTAYFIDAGNLFIDRFAFDPERLRSSIGTGLRYNTAVGPVLLDFAWRLQPDPKVGDTCVTGFDVSTSGSGTQRTCLQQATDRYKIHFAIGVF